MLACARLGMSLQLKFQYLKRTVPGVGSIMVPIYDSLREAFLPEIFGGEEVSSDLREILGHSVKRDGLGILDPCMLVKRAYNTSKAAIEVLVGSLLGITYLNYVAHKGFVRISRTDRRK